MSAAAASSSTSKTTYKVPTGAISGQADLQAFHQSKTFSDLLSFIRLCNEKVRGIPANDDTFPVSPAIASLTQALDGMYEWVTEIPPLQQPMRFGNKAFRDWHIRLCREGPTIIANLLPTEMKEGGAIDELLPYLTSAFGHERRIDYGTGHESSFVVFLFCLFHLGVLIPDDLTAAILKAFKAYLRVMRRLQTEYMLEPAGSHGVWGLDDYHCLVFLWGSSQLIGHPNILPASIHSEEILQEYSEEYLYLSQIAFVRKLKHGVPFAESSPMLNDISALPTWSKVNAGMQRLYEGEVLGKLPVIQHFVFGSLFPATWTPSGPSDGPPPQESHTGMESTVAPWAAETRANPPTLPINPAQQRVLHHAAVVSRELEAKTEEV